MPFGQSYLAGKAAEKVAESVTGSKGFARLCHLVTSKVIAIATLDPAGHSASYIDLLGTGISDAATDSAGDSAVNKGLNASSIAGGKYLAGSKLLGSHTYVQPVRGLSKWVLKKRTKPSIDTSGKA